VSKSLIITEKPSVSRDITEALGGFTAMDGGDYYESEQYVCTFAVGHILGLLSPEDLDPKYKRWKLADLPIIPEAFKMKPLPSQEKRIKVIAKLMRRKDVDTLINSCDAAREGELIFREIVEFVEVKKPIKRLWLQSMTKQAIKAGFAQLIPGEQYDGLASAAFCRAQSDWLIGMNATRALTVRLKSKSERGSSWSAGRVQTPTLALLVHREIEILNHVPVPFCRIEGQFKAPTHAYQATWFDPKFKRNDADPDARDDRIFDISRANAIIEKVQSKTGSASETRKERPRKAPLLFDLTSLQRDANRRFGWAAVRTLRAAQRCYEAHKVLTYPRTSSRVLPSDYGPEVTRLLNQFTDSNTAYSPHAKYLLEKGLKNADKIFDDSGVTDHFAIIPTGEIRSLDGDDKRLFDLVTRQFLAAFYPQAVFEEVERITLVEGESFRSRPPQVLKDPGWLAVFEREAEEKVEFPPLVPAKAEASGVGVSNLDLKREDAATKPPGRIGEAGLLGLMENAGRQVVDEELAQALQKAEGLGTAATRADIIEGLKDREYVDQGLRPTVKGIRLIDVLERIKAGTLTSAELTAKLELHLSEVESGKRTSAQFMDEVKAIATGVVDATRNFDYDSIYPDIDPIGPCPKCKGPVYERAWFYGCKESTKRTDQAKSCDFLIWKDNYGRYMDRRTVFLLLTAGITGELDGFKSQSGQSYKAVLMIENGTVIRKAVEGSESSGAPEGVSIELNEEPLGQCPIHDNEQCRVIETPAEFVCMTRKTERAAGHKTAPGFSFPRFICKREMKRDEVLQFMRDKETPFLNNFISKKGRPFSAKLRFQSNGGFAFEFPERKKATKGQAKEDAPASEST
jgi:DNA topoisomerase-3